MADLRRLLKPRDKKRLLELGKDALIALLLVSAILLANKGGLLLGSEKHPLDSLWQSITGGGEGGSQQSGELAAAAWPFCIVATPQEGSHRAFCWGDELLPPMYERFSAVLGEALGSSQDPAAVTEADWRSALSGSGVYFDFINEQQLSVLAAWLGTGMSGGAGPNTARRIVLAKDGESVALYYLRPRDATPYRCATALSWSAVSERMTDCVPNGAVFNFERSEPFEGVDPMTIIMAQAPEVPLITAVNTMPEDAAGAEALMDALGMNSYLAQPYPDQDGTVVYVEGEAVVRIGPNGVVRYTGGSSDGSERLPQSSAIERVRLLAETTLGGKAGIASLMLSGISYNTDTEEYTIRFDYCVNGLPVYLEGGYSALKVVLGGSSVISATLCFRGYSDAGGTVEPLASLQAAAATEVEGGGEPRLCYFDDLSAVSPRWLIK